MQAIALSMAPMPQWADDNAENTDPIKWTNQQLNKYFLLQFHNFIVNLIKKIKRNMFWFLLLRNNI